ncbi:hypothetical protein vseg_017117 [Gypsophila vaccaria]
MEMMNNKWATTVASIYIQCTSGTPSTFGIYSPVIKSSQNYTQTTLDTVALFKDLGANVGTLAGVVYAATGYSRSRFGGPRVVIFAGCVQCFVGYFSVWLCVTGVVAADRPLPVWVMCFLMFVAGHAMPFFNTADVVTAVHNFRDYSGTAVGIMKGFLGLSAAMLIQLYRTVSKGNPATFLLIVSLLSTINPLFLMWFVKIYDSNDGNERNHLNSISWVMVILSAYLVAVIVLENVITVPLFGYVLIILVLLLLLTGPIWIALRAQLNKPSEIDTEKLHKRDDDVGYQELPNNPEDEDGDSSNRVPELEGHFNLFQAMGTLNFWLLFLATACALGSGLATLNNLTQIGEALGYTTLETTTLVSLWSIWNSLGRFGAGYVSDYILHLKGWARPMFMASTLAMMSIGHLIIASGIPGCLYAGSVVVGICYGSQLSLMPTIASEIFGVVNMGTIFNTITIAGPLGSYILSVRVVGYIYDKESSGEGNTCIGVHCFMLSFLIMSVVTLLGSLFALALSLRTKNYYERVIVRRLLHSPRQ